ncbi:hypothetical protein DelCs14_2652 [Delftia sp. Cs1-4]|nr:hypothetical protein DelCs14_2652 [Delftia sp. Cs1-4]
MASKKPMHWRDKRASLPDNDEPHTWPAPAGLFTPGTNRRHWRNKP